MNNMKKDYPRTGNKFLEKDEQFENILRPKKIDEFIGNKNAIENLKVFIEAAKQRNEPLEHVLLVGPPGLGKTTIAHIIANEMGSSIHVTSGPIFARPYDLFALLSNIKEKEVAFIDEIHRMPRQIEEYMYSAMEDRKLYIKLDKGPHGKHIDITLKPHTIVGATTRYGLLTAPIRSRFSIQIRLTMYGVEELAQIVMRSASILDISIDEKAAEEIGRRSRGTPRIANNLLRRVRDFAQVKGVSPVNYDFTVEVLEKMGIDKLGLDELDIAILNTIIHKFDGGPVGINNIANAINEEPDTIEEVYEPYLIQIGFIQRTPRGRIATPHAYRYFGLPVKHQRGLFD